MEDNTKKSKSKGRRHPAPAEIEIHVGDGERPKAKAAPVKSVLAKEPVEKDTMYSFGSYKLSRTPLILVCYGCVMCSTGQN
jgi:hypothetical protein